MITKTFPKCGTPSVLGGVLAPAAPEAPTNSASPAANASQTRILIAPPLPRYPSTATLRRARKPCQVRIRARRRPVATRLAAQAQPIQATAAAHTSHQAGPAAVLEPQMNK